MPRRKKVVVDDSVLERSRERVDTMFEEYESIWLAFSGGKDSGLVLNLLLEGWERHDDFTNPIRVHHVDDEFKHHETDEFIFRLIENNPEKMHFYWCCLPVAYSRQTNMKTNKWYPWNPEKKDSWIREKPDLSDYDNAEIVEQDHHLLTEWEFGDRHYDAASDIMANFMRENDVPDLGLIQSVGLRTSESLNRHSTITRLGGWRRMEGNRCPDDAKFSTAFPVYDWDDYELWAIHEQQDWDYNETYDKLHQLGYAPNDMRTAAVFGTMPIRSREMWDMKSQWPELYEKAEQRMEGAHLSFLFGMDLFDPKLPEDCDSWREMCNRLINSMDEDDASSCQSTIQNKIDKHAEHSNVPLKDSTPCTYCGSSWKNFAVYLNSEKNTILRGGI